MKIYYKKDGHIMVVYEKHELQQGVILLKALAEYYKAPHINQALTQVEKDLNEWKPRIGYSQYHHLCELCCTEIDIRKDQHLHKVDGNEEHWMHTVCPTLKDPSQRER